MHLEFRPYQEFAAASAGLALSSRGSACLERETEMDADTYSLRALRAGCALQSTLLSQVRPDSSIWKITMSDTE